MAFYKHYRQSNLKPKYKSVRSVTVTVRFKTQPIASAAPKKQNLVTDYKYLHSDTYLLHSFKLHLLCLPKKQTCLPATKERALR